LSLVPLTLLDWTKNTLYEFHYISGTFTNVKVTEVVILGKQLVQLFFQLLTKSIFSLLRFSQHSHSPLGAQCTVTRTAWVRVGAALAHNIDAFLSQGKSTGLIFTQHHNRHELALCGARYEAYSAFRQCRSYALNTLECSSPSFCDTAMIKRNHHNTLLFQSHLPVRYALPT